MKSLWVVKSWEYERIQDSLKSETNYILVKVVFYQVQISLELKGNTSTYHRREGNAKTSQPG